MRDIAKSLLALTVLSGFLLCASAAWAQPRVPPEIMLREARVAEEYAAARQRARQLGLYQERRDLITAKEERIADSVAIRIAQRIDRTIQDLCDVALKSESTRPLVPRGDVTDLCGRTGIRGLIYIAGEFLPKKRRPDIAVMIGRPPTASEAIDGGRSWLAAIASELAGFTSLKVGDVVPLDEATRLGSYVLEGISDWAEYRATKTVGLKSYMYLWVGASADFWSTWFAYAGTLPRGLESIDLDDAATRTFPGTSGRSRSARKDDGRLDLDGRAALESPVCNERIYDTPQGGQRQQCSATLCSWFAAPGTYPPRPQGNG